MGSTEADRDARWAAFERKALQDGEILWEENGAVVRAWTSEHSDFFVVVFDAGRGKLLGCFEWTLCNMSLQESCPREPDADSIAAASSGKSYTREQVVELQPGQRQM